jgi:hypothetical protein
MLQENHIKHVRANVLNTYQAIAKAAFNDVFNANVLRKLDIDKPASKGGAGVSAPVEEVSSTHGTVDSKVIVTSRAELEAIAAVRMRLAFLAHGDPSLYDAIGKVGFRDYQGKLVVYYEKERKGRLLDIIEAKDGSITFNLADDAGSANEISSLDTPLISIFRKRVDGAASG